ncbi:MAG: zinc-binding dehydrogenase [Pirellulaceae bacterium]
MMKAAYITHLGDLDALSVGDLQRPERAASETILRVEAVGLNWLDVLLRTEDFGLTFPHIPGSDVVGVVEETRSPLLTPGDVVVVNPAIPCGKCDGEATNADECRFVRILGVHGPGGYGSFISVPDSQIYQAPAGMSVTEAAAFPLDYLTAWRMLVTKADLKPGESVFIWGASGSLGCAAVAIARSLGAIVIAAAGTQEFADSLLTIGADHIILYKTENVLQRVKALTHGDGVDCVFESIGAATFETSMRAVRPHGRIVICGTRSGNAANVNLEDLYYNQIRVYGSRMGTRSEFEEILSRITGAAWRPVVAAELPLIAVRAAHGLLQNRTKIGKIVLRHE